MRAQTTLAIHLSIHISSKLVVTKENRNKSSVKCSKWIGKLFVFAFRLETILKRETRRTCFHESGRESTRWCIDSTSINENPSSEKISLGQFIRRKNLVRCESWLRARRRTLGLSDELFENWNDLTSSSRTNSNSLCRRIKAERKERRTKINEDLKETRRSNGMKSDFVRSLLFDAELRFDCREETTIERSCATDRLFHWNDKSFWFSLFFLFVFKSLSVIDVQLKMSPVQQDTSNNR